MSHREADRMEIDVAYLDSRNGLEPEMRERFAWLRENDPVSGSERDPVWVITKFDDVAWCSKREDRFTSAGGVPLGLPVKGKPR